MPNSAKSRTAGFTDVDVPDQSEKTFIVTGPTAASASQYRACWRHVARECPSRAATRRRQMMPYSVFGRRLPMPTSHSCRLICRISRTCVLQRSLPHGSHTSTC